MKFTQQWSLVLAASMMLVCVNISSAKEIIKVGVVAPMAGDFAALKELTAVIDKRFEELSKGSDYTYQPIFEDSRFEPKTTHLAATKLLNVDKVDIILSIAALSSRIVDPLASRAQVPQLALASDSADSTPWTFTYFNTAADTAQLAIGTAKALGLRSYVAMGQNQEANHLVAAALKKAGRELGVECKADYKWNPSDPKDFRTYLLKVAEQKPDCIFYFPTPPDSDILLKQKEQLGISVELVGIESFELVEDKRLVNGLWVAGVPTLSPSIREKLAAYGIEPRLNYAPYAYDLPGIVDSAVRLATSNNGGHKPSSVEIQKALSQQKIIETSFGSVPLRGQAFCPPPAIIYYENAKARQVTLEELKQLKGVK